MSTSHFVPRFVLLWFSKVFIKNQPVDAYLDHLIQEFRREEITNLRTLYIGGGTPTALTADQLEYLLKELTKSLDLSQMEELTIEANPGDLDPDKIAGLEEFTGQSGFFGRTDLW